MLSPARLGCGLLFLLLASTSRAQSPEPAPTPAPGSAAPARIECRSSFGARQQCPADTSSGVVLARAFGQAPCLLGKTWGYDDTGIWVADGCSGEFVVAA